MPFQRVRPWRERPPSFDAWYGIGEGWMCTPIHPPSGGRSRPSKETLSGCYRWRSGSQVSDDAPIIAPNVCLQVPPAAGPLIQITTRHCHPVHSERAARRQ